MSFVFYLTVISKRHLYPISFVRPNDNAFPIRPVLHHAINTSGLVPGCIHLTQINHLSWQALLRLGKNS